MIPELRDLGYESGRLQCGLTTLETRRVKGDQLEVFKIKKDYEDVAAKEINECFSCSATNGRANRDSQR